MKPMKSMIQALATLLLLGVVLTSCAEDVWFQDGNAKEGMLEYIAANCDYAEGTATVTSIDGGNGKAVITWYGTTYPTE